MNSRAGGHAGPKSPELLLEEMGDLGVPLVCAGGIGTKQDFVRVLRMGYTGAQAGKSVAGIDRIEAAGEIVRRFAEAARRG